MILRSARRLSLIYLLFVIFVVAILLYRSRFLFGLLFEDGGDDAIDPSTIPSLDSNVTFEYLIPKIIHQTYKTEEIPSHWQAAQQAVKNLHPDWEYMFWTDDSAALFIRTHYPSFLSTYVSYTHPIQRADALRYFVLHHFGGVYLDLDIAPYHPLTPLLAYPAFTCRTLPTGISNDVLGAVPHHPFFGRVIDALHAYNRNWLLSYITVMYSTGPLFLSVIWVEYLSELRSKSKPNSAAAAAVGEMHHRVRVLIKGDVEGDSYGFFNNVQGGSWHGADTEIVFWMGRHWVIVTVLGFAVGFAVTACVWRVVRRVAVYCSSQESDWGGRWWGERGVGYAFKELP